MVFYPGDSHVGIVGGWDEDGELLIIHCASSANNVVISGGMGLRQRQGRSIMDYWTINKTHGSLAVGPP